MAARFDAFISYSRAASSTLAVALPPVPAGETEVTTLGVGLYGTNGHQLSPSKLVDHPHVTLVAVAEFGQKKLPDGVARYSTLDELLADPRVEIVSLCSPKRADQARDAIRCLEAGKHVYAEKPSALTEAELDEILAAALKRLEGLQ